MKAPDKLYISPLIYETRLYEFPDEDSVEFIRKKALLEWLNKQLVASAESLRFERNKAFADVIDKINSL